MSQKKENIKNWIISQQNKIDTIIGSSAQKYLIKNKKRPNFKYDIEVCQNESYNLKNQKDLFYDRPSTPFTYALWYQGRRVNISISYLLDHFLNNRERDFINIFDLGAGTGAIQLAIGILQQAFEQESLNFPKVNIINVDTSALMLEYGKDYLWEEFKERYNNKSDKITPYYSVNSWLGQSHIQLNTPWVFASYLFDVTDTHTDLSEGFQTLINTLSPEKIILTTSYRKSDKLKEIENTLKSTFKISELSINDNKMLLKGEMSETNKLRKWLYQEQYGTSFSRKATWDEISFVGKTLTNKALSLPLDNRINLFSNTIKIRRNVKLSDAQKKISFDNGRSTILIGPAGCGKSIVITERIINVVKNYKYKKNELRILVTTFNKGLLQTLFNWVEDLLNKENIAYTYSSKWNKKGVKFDGSKVENISFLHFDILATRIGGIHINNLALETKQKIEIQKCINIVKNEENIKYSKKYDNILNPSYILGEYRRIIYGLDCFEEDKYLNVSRQRRLPKIHSNSKKRNLLWRVMSKYLELKLTSFTSIRYDFVEILRNNNELNNLFTHIFVDEFQDCTPTDYEIFGHLISDLNHLVFTGDHAQAIHLGSSSEGLEKNNIIRKIFKNITQKETAIRPFSHKTLEGSYRLPLNIAKAIKPISIAIQKFIHDNASVIESKKGSPPGIRPILVYGSELNIINKIHNILSTYKAYDLFGNNIKAVILEKDNHLKRQLDNIYPNKIETESILKIKGLEKNVIIWNTKNHILDIDEAEHYAYTIMTRTSCMLVVILHSEMMSVYKDIISRMNEHNLIIWDKETETYYNTTIKNRNPDLNREIITMQTNTDTLNNLPLN